MKTDWEYPLDMDMVLSPFLDSRAKSYMRENAKDDAISSEAKAQVDRNI